MNNRHGYSLIELMTVLVLFSVAMAGLYTAYSVQMKQGVKQYKLAESEMELEIGKAIIDRDLAMAGYGLMDDYDYDADGFQEFTPRTASATNGLTVMDPDTLTLMGTAIGIASRAAQGWSYIETVIAGAPPEPILRTFDDAREDVRDGDYVVIMYPAGKSLLSHGADWLYKYTKGGPSKLDSGDGTFPDSVAGLVLYGLSESGGATVPSQPYYAVHYSLGVIPPPPKTCADGAKNLIRTESITTETPDPDLGKPVLNCVLDFQVAFGLDTDDKGGIDEWDNGGNTTAKDYTPKDLTKRLRQLRVYALVQEGKRDRDYTYANPDPAYSTKVDEVRVGDLTLEGGAVGQDFKLTAEQRKYRWRVVSFTMTSKNMK